MNVLDHAVEQRSLSTILEVQAHPIFDPIRSSPRYSALLRRMGLKSP